MPKLTEQQRQEIRDRRKPPTTRPGSGRKPAKPIKVYALYPTDNGGYSAQSVLYVGIYYTVAATSIRQAYAMAYGEIWADPNDDYPVGLLLRYRRDFGQTLGCGCRGHNRMADPKHGAGIQAIRQALRNHNCNTDA